MSLRFVVSIDKVRYIYRPLPPSQMRKIAQAVADSIRARIKSGKNAKDAAAAALTELYLRRKQRAGLGTLRDWYWISRQRQGRELSSIKVLRANEMKAVIGFADDFTNLIAERQNKIEVAFAASRSDYEVMVAAVEIALKNNRVINLIQVS